MPLLSSRAWLYVTLQTDMEEGVRCLEGEYLFRDKMIDLLLSSSGFGKTGFATALQGPSPMWSGISPA